ncbi:methyltransferase [Streptomyces sp. NBC_00654]|uniref:methyltransferase n=1 Tax=Streptomyces sp. NBC_00654 TaxID=2975799 RepID=UPI002258D981|nr:methyltransferase [Streptomyces sp. NBC_00654]MCX4970498.1 methyltransferase [Streptomyces sp. NBC_00654]
MTSAPRDTSELSAQLSEHMNGYLYTACLYTVTKAGIADHLSQGPRTAAELGEKTGLHGPHLHRVLRYLATREVFREDEHGRFALTPMAELLRTDIPGSLHDPFLMLGEDLFWKPFARMYDTVRTGHTVFDDIFGTGFFAHLQTVPETASVFNAGAAGFSRLWNEHIATSYDFPHGARIIDIGGGTGSLLREILTTHPHTTGTLYDQQSVIAEHQLDTPDTTGRWNVATGDFFDSVPTGADYYILKSVLHDWSDTDCLRILKSVREAVHDNSKLLVVDPVIPPGNQPHASKTIDVSMLAVVDGKERTQAEFEDILTKGRFTVTRILQTPSLMSIVECVPA